MSSAKAERFAALQAGRLANLERRLSGLLELSGDERALDVGAGTGALAFALARLVRRVVAVDSDAGMLERARADAPPNVEAVVADGGRLPFPDASFDLGCTLRTLHHAADPRAVVGELARVVRPGGTVLVADQLAPEEPGAAEALNTFERARDASTTTVLGERALRALLAGAGLVTVRAEITHAVRDLEAYLDLAGCAGAKRERVRALVPPGYEDVTGWFVLARA